MDIKVNVSEPESGKRTLEVEVPVKVVEDRIKSAYANYGKTLTLPGFRKGRIPISVVKSRFGKAIEEEVLSRLMNESYDQAWRTSGIEPISQPVIDDWAYSEGESLRFTAVLEIKPEVGLRKYVGLRGTRPVFPVRDGDVREQLQAMRERSAEDRSVERCAKLGDLIVADLQDLDSSGLPILGRKYEDRTFLIGGDRSFSHDFDNQLVGVSRGDDRRVRFTYNRDLSDPDLAGKEASFAVAVKDVRERILPALDDEFSKDHGAENLADLESRVRDYLSAQSEYLSRSRLESSILSALVQENTFDPPNAMVENVLDGMLENYKKEHEGHDHPLDDQGFRDRGRDTAIYQVRTHLLLEAVAKKEGIEAGDEEVDDRIRRMAEANRQTFETLKRALERETAVDRIRRDIVHGKAVQFLIDGAQVEEVEEAPAGESRIIRP